MIAEGQCLFSRLYSRNLKIDINRYFCMCLITLSITVRRGASLEVDYFSSFKSNRRDLITKLVQQRFVDLHFQCARSS